MNTERKSERPRLVLRHVAQGDVAQQALAVARADRAGIVDGVYVDFRHDQIQPGEWEARAWWYVGADADGDHCGFLLPSAVSAALRVRKQGDRDELVERKLALPRLNVGDKLTIDHVVPEIGNAYFHHRHDKTLLRAYLLVTRANGEVVHPEQPLIFYGVTQLREAFDHGPPLRDAYDRLAERVLADHGNPDPHNFEISLKLRPIGKWTPYQEFSLSERSALALEEAERAWFDLVTNHMKDNPAGQAALRSALNGAVLAAFNQAKHESMSAEEGQQAVRDGGKRARSQPKATDGRFGYAQDIWRDDPKLTTGGLATQVIEQVYLHQGGELITQSAMVESLERAIGRGQLVIPQESPSHPDNRTKG